MEERLFTKFIKKFKVGSYIYRMHFDAVPKPSYAFGIYSAALQAKALGIDRMLSIEFGVAGGNGLVAMEEAAIEIGNEMNIEIDVFGFDLVSGLPPNRNYQDLKYWFVPGSFSMDVEKLKSRLRKATLVLGDIRETIPKFLSDNNKQIGFCSFDLDYYSSTKEAFRIFEGASLSRLPRVICYFDDIIGVSDLTIHCDRVGQLCAIKEFNAENTSKYLYPIFGLGGKRPIHSDWNEQIYAMHDFAHPQYNNVVNPYSSDDATASAKLVEKR
jgi:hypothetical protein